MSEWWACEEPERPTDPYIRWHYKSCRGCQVKAAAKQRELPDDTHVRWLNETIETNNQEAGGQ